MCIFSFLVLYSSRHDLHSKSPMMTVITNVIVLHKVTTENDNKDEKGQRRKNCSRVLSHAKLNFRKDRHAIGLWIGHGLRP